MNSCSPAREQHFVPMGMHFAQRLQRSSAPAVPLHHVGGVGLLAPGAASPTSKLAYIAYGLAAVCAGAGCVLLALGPARAPLGVLLLAVALPAQALASAQALPIWLSVSSALEIR